MSNQQQQFIQLIKENEKIIFKVLAVYANELVDKKDWYQEIVLQLWKAYPSFRADAKASTWIYRIALNTVVTQFRKNKNKIKSTTLDASILQIADFKENTLEEPLRLLYQQINQLNQLDKALVLLYLEDKSYQEIAEITGLSVTNVASRLSRIKKKMKQNLNEQKWI
jgi:RNA polymerase sigma-70 factor (ECF subfamily)